MRNKTVIGVAVMALVACAGSPEEEESVLAKNDAIDDYIEVAELKAIDQLRHKRDLEHKQITENYILLYDGRDPYLVAFVRRCFELNTHEASIDYRNEARSLRAGFDRYFSCKIRNIYEVTPGQATELLGLGDKLTQ